MWYFRVWLLAPVLCYLGTLASCVEERDLLVITVATNETNGYQRFMRSLRVYGLQVKVLGLGVTWEGGNMENNMGGGHKINLLKSELYKYKDDENKIIMFTDSYDVIVTGGKNTILEKFDSLDARVVFGAEDFCWPDKSLAENYPRVSFGYKYLNSGGFIGYASDLYGVVSSHNIRNDEDDQLYYSQIYINKELRNKYKMKLDTHSRIFQNLNGQFGDISLKFEDDDVRIQNTVYQTIPVIIHGNGPTKVLLNSLGNYLAKSWIVNEGCLACEENKLEMETVVEEDLPQILFGVFIEKPVPFLEEMLGKIELLDYPKHKMDLFVHNQVKLHEELASGWVANLKSLGYRSVKYISISDNIKEWHARNLAVELCLKNNCDGFFSIDGEVHLDNPKTLSLLLSHNRPILAAGMVRDGQAWSTFWGAVNEDGFYARSMDYMDIVNNKRSLQRRVPSPPLMSPLVASYNMQGIQRHVF